MKKLRSDRMRSSRYTAIAALILAGFTAAACSSKSTPASPTGSNTSAVPADGSTLKVSAPTNVSPINDFQVVGTPTLTINGSSLTYATPGSAALQYRFEVFNAAGTKVQD